ncbi:hypothetical protein WICPIJ_005765 [Wickerhamomyces pijperi]|uniref:HRQ family protein 1 n=1 Tax=Wickerhamomyces pijperi TaxID=599730 RepID=A0A9P8Q546_WICPI|nr:hypothetical protein WICPIJ_005765 [Wickerhamomyces pijperi]
MGLLIQLFDSLEGSPLQTSAITAVASVSIFIASLASLVVYYNSSSKTIKPLPAKIANNKARKLGTWKPEDYKLPVPPAYPEWDIKTFKPLPYRAFKHKYNVTMGIRNMDPNSWIELDNEWNKFHDLKMKRIEEKGEEVYGTLPEAKAASLELLEELRKFLPARYPSLFERTADGMKNLETGEVHRMVEPLLEDPMLTVARLLQDDVAIMIENEQGEYYLKGGCIMLAGFWRLKDKFNTSLSTIHTSGDVPKYNTHLKKGMEKFFVRLTPEAPVVRNNYFIQTDDNLDWSSSIGDEDNETVGWYTADPAKSVEKIWYRSERQSVRRLPITGAVIFTIRTYFLPLTEMCKEPYVPKRLLDGIESWSDDVREYRGYDKFYEVVLPYLREKVAEQAAMGYTDENEAEQYPF